METFCIRISLFLLIASALAVAGNQCRTCDHYQAVDICLVSTHMGAMTPLAKLSQPEACGQNAKVFQINDFRDVEKVFYNISNSCQRIKNLNFFGHGSNFQLRNMITSFQWLSLKRYSCVMMDNAHVDTRACNIGRGCDGALQMYRIAQSLFAEKSGKITSPTFYTFALYGRPESLFSIPDRILKYEPNLNKKLIFSSASSETTSLESEIVRECKTEIHALKVSVDDKQKFERTASCAEKMNSTQEYLKRAESAIAAGDLQIFFTISNFYQVQSLRDLKRFIRQACQ
jgi:hypothetical protein